MMLGVLCMLGAIGFVAYNRWEEESAAQVTQSLLADVQFDGGTKTVENPKLALPALLTVSISNVFWMNPCWSPKRSTKVFR